MSSGIYCLLFGNTKYYIGKSTDVNRRYKEHIKALNNNTSFKNLLLAFNTYGYPEFLILETCLVEELSDKEHAWINYLNGYNILNVYKDGKDNAVGELNPNSKYSEELISEVFLYIANNLNISLAKVSEKYSIPINTLKGITSGRIHVWLKEKFPEEYLVIKNSVNYRKSLNAPNARRGSFLSSPEGVVVEVTTSISAFAKEHGLQTSNLSNVINKKALSHKGWTLFKGG